MGCARTGDADQLTDGVRGGTATLARCARGHTPVRRGRPIGTRHQELVVERSHGYPNPRGGQRRQGLSVQDCCLRHAARVLPRLPVRNRGSRCRAAQSIGRRMIHGLPFRPAVHPVRYRRRFRELLLRGLRGVQPARLYVRHGTAFRYGRREPVREALAGSSHRTHSVRQRER